jgi:hypothetical protein
MHMPVCCSLTILAHVIRIISLLTLCYLYAVVPLLLHCMHFQGCFQGFDLYYVHVGMNRLWNDVFISNGWQVQYDITGQFLMTTAKDCDDDTYMQVVITPTYYLNCLNLEPLCHYATPLTLEYAMCMHAL